MGKKNVFGALRATSIAALCAGAGLTLAGCEKAQTKSTDAAPAPGAKPLVEKPGGEMACGGDHKCSPNGCSAKK